MDTSNTSTRTINLNTEVLINEADWTLNFGITDRDAIEAHVRSWARHLITEALRANGIAGMAR